jgi:hypothetical protein
LLLRCLRWVPLPPSSVPPPSSLGPLPNRLTSPPFPLSPALLPAFFHVCQCHRRECMLMSLRSPPNDHLPRQQVREGCRF